MAEFEKSALRVERARAFRGAGITLGRMVHGRVYQPGVDSRRSSAGELPPHLRRAAWMDGEGARP